MNKLFYKVIIGIVVLICFVGTTQSIIAEAKQNIYATYNTKIYHVRDKKDLEKLDQALIKRNGKIIIEIIDGKVINKKGDGKDTCGYYIKYDKKRFKKGNKVQSVFVYNPDTNYMDDILYRVDTLIKKEDGKNFM